MSALAPQGLRTWQQKAALLLGVRNRPLSAHYGGYALTRFGPAPLEAGPILGPSPGCDDWVFSCKGLHILKSFKNKPDHRTRHLAMKWGPLGVGWARYGRPYTLRSELFSPSYDPHSRVRPLESLKTILTGSKQRTQEVSTRLRNGHRLNAGDTPQ